MKIQEIIEGLESLADDRESFFDDDGDDEIFRHDYAVCMAAIDQLKLVAQDNLLDALKARIKKAKEK